MTILLIANSIVHAAFLIYHARFVPLAVMTVVNIPIYAALIVAVFFEKKLFLLPFNIAQVKLFFDFQ
jgi:hypothetical protein